MEELLPFMKEKLKEKIEVKVDRENLTISLNVKGDLIGKFLYPDEIPKMLKLYGGLREDLQMDIKINEKEQKAEIILENENDFKKIQSIMENIWDDAIKMAEELFKGNYKVIKDIPNIDD